MKKLLVGGGALRVMGSDRHTEDMDYLICHPTSTKMFAHHATSNTDYLNANGSEFFMEVWNMEAANNSELASPQAILELKAYALVQHCQNGNFAKADACEYDIKFLVRNYDVNAITLAHKYISIAELKEVQKIIASVKK